MKRETLQYLDGIGQLYDENLRIYLEDLDFFFRCSLLGLRARFIEDRIAIHKPFDFNKDRSLRNYLCLRNNIYLNIKFFKINIPDKPNFKYVFSTRAVILKIVAMIFNFDFYKGHSIGVHKGREDGNSNPGRKGYFQKITKMLDPSAIITSRHYILFY